MLDQHSTNPITDGRVIVFGRPSNGRIHAKHSAELVAARIFGFKKLEICRHDMNGDRYEKITLQKDLNRYLVLAANWCRLP